MTQQAFATSSDPSRGSILKGWKISFYSSRLDQNGCALPAARSTGSPAERGLSAPLLSRSHYIGRRPSGVVREDRIPPGAGFSEDCGDTGILTYVLDGELDHEAAGARMRLRAGDVRYTSLGAGERQIFGNGSSTIARFLQLRIDSSEESRCEPMWLPGDSRTGKCRLGGSLGDTVGISRGRREFRVLSGQFEGATNGELGISPDSRLFVFVTRGCGIVNDSYLVAGDSLLLDGGCPLLVSRSRSAELLVVEFHE